MSTSPVNTIVTSPLCATGCVVGPPVGSDDGWDDGDDVDASGVAESDDSVGVGCSDVAAGDAVVALVVGKTVAGADVDDVEHAARSRTSAVPPAAAWASRLARCMPAA
jgi:hypothetical protein